MKKMNKTNSVLLYAIEARIKRAVSESLRVRLRATEELDDMTVIRHYPALGEDKNDDLLKNFAIFQFYERNEGFAHLEFHNFLYACEMGKDDFVSKEDIEEANELAGDVRFVVFDSSCFQRFLKATQSLVNTYDHTLLQIAKDFLLANELLKDYQTALRNLYIK